MHAETFAGHMTGTKDQIAEFQRSAAYEPARKKVFVKSYGCQMNAYDGIRMSDVLAPVGFDETGVMEQADLIILNTCHIREKASEKVFSELGKIRELKLGRAERGLETIVAVAGCVAQAEGAEIFRRQKSVDLVVGPQSYHRLPELLAKARTGQRVVDTDFPAEDKFDFLPPASAARTRFRGLSAFLTVQEGCDKFCTFCVVPYTRGAELSRPVAKIVQEAKQLVTNGVREISLLGQNVNAYHGIGLSGTQVPLAVLLQSLAEIPGLLRLRYITSHPTDMSDDLIAAHTKLPTLMPFLHLPVQSGSDRILAAMNRGHTAAQYIGLVGRVRAARSDIALSTDLIVGFPGETEDDFQATLNLAATVNFASSYFFKYSARPGTPGADMADHVPESVMAERLSRLQSLVEGQRHAFNQSMTGKVLDVLFEKAGRYPGQITGRSPYLQPVHVDADAGLIGAIHPVEITESGTNSLFGRLAKAPPKPNSPEVQA